MSLRVCLLTSAHGAFDIRIFYKECRSLALAGYEVTLVAPHSCDEVVDRVQIRAVPSACNRLSRMTQTVWQVFRKALQQDAKIYHFHDPELIPAGLLLRICGKKVVYDIHEDLPRTVPYKCYIPRWIGRPLAWLVERIENSACRRFSALTPATSTIARRFHSVNDNTVVVQNYPIVRELVCRTGCSWGERANAVTYLGANVTASRGTVEMVQAMGLLPAGLDARLELAGSFESQALREKVACLPGWDRVNPLGVLERRSVAELLGRVRAGLVVLHPEPNHLRAMPIKLFEYMCAGIPVVASDFPLWRGIVEGARCGLLVDPLDPKAIATAIEYLLTHPREAQVMGDRGRQAVNQQYNWESEERKLLTLYAALAGPVYGG